MPPVRPEEELGPLGLVLPTFPQYEDPDELGATSDATSRSDGGGIERLAAVAAGAERSGAGALWACDHLYWSGPVLECLTALTVAAAVTSRVTLGTCVLQLPLRSPAVVAKQAATLQALTGDRFVLGVGVGSHRGEYEACRTDFATRGRRLDQALDELARIWSTGSSANGDDGASPSIGGRRDERRGAGYRQLPLPAPVPVWVGGSSDAALLRAASRGQGWIPTFLTVDEYPGRLGLLRELQRSSGRSEDAVTPAAVAFVRTGETAAARREGTAWLSSLYGIPSSAFDRHLIAGSARDCACQLERYLDAGARHVAVMVADDRASEHFGPVCRALQSARTRQRSAPSGSAVGRARGRPVTSPFEDTKSQSRSNRQHERVGSAR